MSDAFPHPDHPPPHHPRTEYHPQHHDYRTPPNSSPFDDPNSSASYATYPWAPEPGPAPARAPRQASPPGHHGDLRALRGAYRWQRRVATLTALGYFTLFLLLSAFVPSLMSGEITTGLPLGLLLGLLQVPVTCAAIGVYEYTARRRLDPLADRIRRLAELDARRKAAR